MKSKAKLMKNNIVIGVTGASGAIYANNLITKLGVIAEQFGEIALVFTKNAAEIWKYELGERVKSNIFMKVYEINDFNAPFASGSTDFSTLIICPCSMGTLGKIATGVSDNIITRCADVMLKERRKLILVTRETPLNLIHINNMQTVAQAGGIILPASPSFYSKPENIDQVVGTVTSRIMKVAGIDNDSYRWQQ